MRAFVLALLLMSGLPAAAQQHRSLDMSPEIQTHLAAAQQAQAAQDYATAGTEYETVIRLAPQFAEAYMNLGLVHQLQGRDTDAMQNFRSALKLKPTLIGANFFLGVDFCKLGDGRTAIPYLKAAISQRPDQVEMLSWLATAQDLSGQWSSEAATLNRALQLQPGDANLLYLLGQTYEHLGKQQAAALKKSDPDSARAEQLVAESYSSTNEWPSAVIHFENAIAKAPKQPGLHVELGEVFLHAGKLKAAASEFENELAINPKSMRAFVRRGETRLVLGETEAALKDWDRALETDAVLVQRILGIQPTGFGDTTLLQLPEPLRSRFVTVQAELQENRSPAAELARCFMRLQSGNSESACSLRSSAAPSKTCSAGEVTRLLEEERYTQLPVCTSQVLAAQTPVGRKLEVAGALVDAGEYDSSLRVLNSLPAPQRQSSIASFWRARCYEKMATAAYLRLYEADPNSFRIHQLAGDLAATRNEDGKAIEEYRIAVSLNGNAPNLHYSLGHTLWKILKIPEARVELEAELKINPRHAGALHDLGDSYLQEHQPEKALPYLQQAVAAYPENPDIHRDLGTAYSQLRQFDKAVPEYKIGLTNDQDGSVHYKLAKVYQALGEKERADHEFAIYTAMNRESHEKLEKRGQRLADIERSAE